MQRIVTFSCKESKVYCPLGINQLVANTGKVFYNILVSDLLELFTGKGKLAAPERDTQVLWTSGHYVSCLPAINLRTLSASLLSDLFSLAINLKLVWIHTIFVFRTECSPWAKKKTRKTFQWLSSKRKLNVPFKHSAHHTGRMWLHL